ncbi:oligosaccharide flippase family protein [Clostridium sp. AL.422]|uniref:oligosaccharide flippase family protein n=1 Tax=Clostridium TaxID=1485 RepID=UPI00293DCE0C|nr:MULTISPECIES: oligosaccharide flippase family protein [unclassified Clostridium]MDV4150427.1 oligosaccharide flippase family protein [Clostridium sp. AL.422]
MSNKKILKNYLYNIVYECLILILPFITASYISRVLGVNGVGGSDYTSSFAVLFSSFAKLGIDRYGSKHIAFKRESKTTMSETFWNIWSLQVCSSLIATVVYIIFFLTLGKSLKLLFLLQLPILLSAILDISWFYIGLENFKKIVVRNTVIRVICVILILTFVKSYDDIGIYILINSTASFLGSLTYWISIFKHVNKLDISRLNIKPFIKESIVYFIPQICIQLYTVADQIIVGSLTSITEIGYYSQSLKVPRMSLAFITSLSTVLMPTIANLYEKNNTERIERYLKKSLQITICIGVFGASSMAAVANKFIPLFFGEEFTLITPYMMTISLIAIIIPVGLVFSNQYIVPTNKNKEYIIPIISAALVSLISNFILIPIIGITGAVVAVILSELTSTTLKVILVQKYLDIRLLFKKSNIYFLFGLVNFILVNFITSLLKTNIVSLLISCGLCFVFYGTLMIIINNPIKEELYDIYNSWHSKISIQ